MVIQNLNFLKGPNMTEVTPETPEVTEGHPDNDSENELAPDDEVDSLVDGVSTDIPEDASSTDGTD